MGAFGPKAALPLVFVTVGTDHHPFDRLVAWVDAWVRGGGGGRARVLVQSGTSKRPTSAEWRAYLTKDEMAASMAEASCVVCHGGPSTIIDSARYGVRPIVVPRMRDLGEHVDDHQVAFVRWIATQQDVFVATTEQRTHDLMDLAVTDPAAVRTPSTETDAAPAIEALERWIDELVAGRRARPVGTT